MDRELCRMCGGSGGGLYPSSPDPENESYEFDECRSCYGTGYEVPRRLGPRTEKERQEKREQHQRAMDAAITVVERYHSGERKK